MGTERLHGRRLALYMRIGQVLEWEGCQLRVTASIGAALVREVGKRRSPSGLLVVKFGGQVLEALPHGERQKLVRCVEHNQARFLNDRIAGGQVGTGVAE